MDKNTKNRPLADLNISIVVASVVVILGLALLMMMDPDKSAAAANDMLGFVTNTTGVIYLWFGAFVFIFCLWFCFSKNGALHLGKGKPQFSTFSYLAMIISACFGGATLYWGFMESIYYYMTPPSGVEPLSAVAAERSLSYVFNHWGLLPWSMNVATAIPIAYYFYIKKGKELKISEICRHMYGNKIVCKPVRWLLDFLFVFVSLGAISMTLGVGLPAIERAIATLLGIEPTFLIDVIIIVAISVMYSLSSYVGIEKGMHRISDMNLYIVLGFILFILIVGPTQFIFSNTTNAVGIYLQNVIYTSLWTDPILNGGFPQGWTIFFWASWLSFAPFMGVFITRISKGRTFRSMIITTIFIGALGTFGIFGIMESYALNLQITNAADLVSMIAAGDGNGALMAVLQSLPGGRFWVLIYLIGMFFFIATSLDSCSYSLASTTTKKLDENANPSPILRLIWCVILASIPLVLTYIQAPLETIKTVVTVAAFPYIFVILFLCVGVILWVSKGDKENGTVR